MNSDVQRLEPDTPTTPGAGGPPKPDRCPECGSVQFELDPRRGETVCSRCGLVLEDKHIDFGPEWRAFGEEGSKNRQRTGAPLTESLHDYGLSTVVGRGQRDAHGKRIPANQDYTIRRLRRLQNRTVLSAGGGRNLAAAITEIQRIATAANIPRVTAQRAINLYRQATERHLIRGRSIDGVSAAAVYAACRLEGIPRSPDQISEASHVDRRTLLRIHRMLVHELDLRSMPVGPAEYLPRFASALELDARVEARARELVNDAEAHGLASGRSPLSLAAAAIYLASHEQGDPRVQKQVSEAAGVSEVTLRARAKEFVKVLGARAPGQ
ncbi:MAG TPA: TFIIB-type zinc ribbon-containing protein [Candidatus Thermoplasmatota archaeon]|nr:TFIIB-type zinc ribbon-containing protein [Candidatus Thermoplasmatota archaeon]